MHLKHLAPVAALLAALWILAVAASAGAAPGAPHQLLTGLGGGSGSTVGPDGALYVNDTVNGKIVRVDPSTGASSTYADCLPRQLGFVGIGGGMDVAFIGSTAYALVSIVSDPFLGLASPPNPADGIYRIDGAHSCSLVADIGAWSIAHPPHGFAFFLQAGVQYAMQPWRGGFLVTDGHHNRVLRVGLDGSISELKAFGDVVPTGLDVQGDTIYLAEAGAIVPGGAENGRIVAIDAHSGAVSDVAASGPLMVDVERGRGETLFGLAQGTHSNENPGSPADPNTGKLLRVDGHGGFSVVATGLDRPTSLEIIGNTAYIATLTGQIWVVDNISAPPFGG
jgi:sugar lactone lactonase YvrE